MFVRIYLYILSVCSAGTPSFHYFNHSKNGSLCRGGHRASEVCTSDQFRTSTSLPLVLMSASEPTPSSCRMGHSRCQNKRTPQNRKRSQRIQITDLLNEEQLCPSACEPTHGRYKLQSSTKVPSSFIQPFRMHTIPQGDYVLNIHYLFSSTFFFNVNQ